MALIDELKEQLAKTVQYVDTETALVRAHQRNVEDWLGRIDDLDRAIAALEPAPELEAPVQDLPSPELLSDPGSEENAGTNFDKPEIPEGFTRWEGGECPVPHGTRVEIWTRASLKHERGIQWTVYEDMPRWPHENAYDDIIAYRIISQPADQSEPEPVSVLDDPELQAAVDRAEQTLAMVDEQTCEPVDARVSWSEPDEGGYAPVTEPERKAGVLEDPELDAEYEEMKRRETANQKLHFSIFGKLEDA